MIHSNTNNITYEKDNNKFNFRVAGIVIHQGKVLLHTTEHDDFWNLPGGRVEFNETTEAAIVREMFEELGVHVQPQKVAFVSEDFFNYDGMMYHEIGFYYVITLPENHRFYHETEFKGLEENGKLLFRWFPLEELQHMEVHPVFLKKDLLNLHDVECIKHYVQK